MLTLGSVSFSNASRVYIDGFNLYYGARALCGRGSPGWRWLDLRALATRLVSEAPWSDAAIARVVYCTARVSGADNETAHVDQDIYLKALLSAKSADHIEFGKFISKVRMAPLAVSDRKGRPQIVRSTWPVMVQGEDGADVSDARFIVSSAYREEKGSDVSVASHLLLDVLQGHVDAAIVVSNDSDLRHPVQEARKRVPVGTVNPSRAFLAGDLRGSPGDGVGRHWWRQLSADDFKASQLPDLVGRYAKPVGW